MRILPGKGKWCGSVSKHDAGTRPTQHVSARLSLAASNWGLEDLKVSLFFFLRTCALSPPRSCKGGNNGDAREGWSRGRAAPITAEELIIHHGP
jgi:hypothetical protein